MVSITTSGKVLHDFQTFVVIDAAFLLLAILFQSVELCHCMGDNRVQHGMDHISTYSTMNLENHHCFHL